MLYFKAYLSVKTIDVRGKHAKILIVLQATSNCFSSRGTTATDKKKHKALDIRAYSQVQTLFFNRDLGTVCVCVGILVAIPCNNVALAVNFVIMQHKVAFDRRFGSGKIFCDVVQLDFRIKLLSVLNVDAFAGYKRRFTVTATRQIIVESNRKHKVAVKVGLAFGAKMSLYRITVAELAFNHVVNRHGVVFNCAVADTEQALVCIRASYKRYRHGDY